LQPLTANNDDALLRLMSHDSQEAFTTLYRRYWEPLFVSTVKVIGSREDAADIVQEVFFALWRRRHELALIGSLAAYLQTSVKYKAISYIEKNITRRNYLELLGSLSAANATPSAEVMLQVKQTQELIQTVINNMPAKMQRVFQLSRRERLSHREIAALLNISEETVKKHIQHALQLIKAALGQTSLSLAMLLVELLW